MTTFGKTLRTAREKRGKQLIEFAARLGISAGQLSRMERDLVGAVDATKLRCLAKTYGIPLNRLLDLLERRREG